MESLELFHGTKIAETRKVIDETESVNEQIEANEDDNGSDVHEEVNEGQLLVLMKSLRAALKDSSSSIIDGVDAEAPTGGMSLLALKNLLMADYLSNMLSLAKSRLARYVPKAGKNINPSESPENVVARLAELRVILERIRPVEAKLKPMIDRLVRQANQEKNFAFSSESEPKSLRARPEDMVIDDDEEDGGDDGEDGDKQAEEGEGSGGEEPEKEGKVRKYKPPQLSAAYYDPRWEESAAGVNRRKSSATSTEKRLMMQEMLARAEGDEPDEITNEEEGMGFLSANEKRRKQEEERHRQRFEEDNFIRLPTAKGKKFMPTVGSADKVLLYGRDGADDDDLRVFASNDGSEMPMGYNAAAKKKFKKMEKKQKKKQKRNNHKKKPKRARRK